MYRFFSSSFFAPHAEHRYIELFLNSEQNPRGGRGGYGKTGFGEGNGYNDDLDGPGFGQGGGGFGYGLGTSDGYGGFGNQGSCTNIHA